MLKIRLVFTMCVVCGFGKIFINIYKCTLLMHSRCLVKFSCGVLTVNFGPGLTL